MKRRKEVEGRVLITANEERLSIEELDRRNRAWEAKATVEGFDLFLGRDASHGVRPRWSHDYDLDNAIAELEDREASDEFLCCVVGSIGRVKDIDVGVCADQR